VRVNPEPIDIHPIVNAFFSWPDSDKWEFINHWCDDLSVLTYTKLIPSIKSTAEIGHSGVVILVAMEIYLAGKLGVPPDDTRIALWIRTYTGRINLLPDIHRLMRNKQKLNESVVIDEALASQVNNYIGGCDSFNAVARDSDFFTALTYPKTFHKYLEHFVNKDLDFDVIEQFFRDMFISGTGMKSTYLEAFRSVLGDDAVKELFSKHIIEHYDCSGGATVSSFKIALTVFGEDALLETPQFQDYLKKIKVVATDLDLLHWMSVQHLAMQDDAPKLFEICVRMLPELMAKHRFTPGGPVMSFGVKMLGGEAFIRHYLGALRQTLDQNNTGVRDWRNFTTELNLAGLEVKSMSDLELVEYAYAVHRQSNNPVSTSIRNACHFAGISETAKVAGDMGIRAAENLFSDVSHDKKRLVIEHFKNSRVLALEVDLGL
jgi:hypothetical protein